MGGGVIVETTGGTGGTGTITVDGTVDGITVFGTMTTPGVIVMIDVDGTVVGTQYVGM
jgi:hypothetical protein